MKNFLRVFIFFFIVNILMTGCKDDVFRIDITRPSSITDVKRSIEMKTSMTFFMPDAQGEIKENKVNTVNKFDFRGESVDKLKDPATPGIYISTEQLKSASYSIAQKRNEEKEKSVTMEYKDGKISVLKKSVPEGEPDGPYGFVNASKQTFETLVGSSNMKAEVTINDRGDILNVSADMSTQMGIAQTMQTYSGANGIIFPEKAVKVGDTWVEKKTAISFSGFKVTGNPVEFEIKFKREKDEKFKGKDVAVFLVDYQIDKKGVDGFYGGFPATVDLKDSKKIKIYFDNKRKTFVKNIMDSETLIVSGTPKNIDPQRPVKISVNVENKSHSERIEKE